ncbi:MULTISPECIES: hypothetical protein [Photorhabdus]|nr:MULTISPECIES: hypothetical protein [Photorhabdus]
MTGVSEYSQQRGNLKDNGYKRPIRFLLFGETTIWKRFVSA